MLRRIGFYLIIGFESGFTGFRGFFIPYPLSILLIKKVLVILSCGLVLNQDLQDFEDYLVLGVVWDGARSSMKFKELSAFFKADAKIA
jgi:hypothetical protein